MKRKYKLLWVHGVCKEIKVKVCKSDNFRLIITFRDLVFGAFLSHPIKGDSLYLLRGSDLLVNLVDVSKNFSPVSLSVSVKAV